MSLIKYDPLGKLTLGNLSLLGEDFEKIFSPTNARNTSCEVSSWTPAVDIQETETAYVVEADIPGVDPKEIDITVDNGAITISGERVSESKEESTGYYRSERVSGSFMRKFTLSDAVDVEGIKATGKNGVLKVNIPKKESSKPRKISVQ